LLLSAGCARSETQSPAQILETANALAAQGDLGGAIRTLQDALATAPDNIELRRLEARLHLRNGDAAAGEASLRQLLARGVPSEQLLEDLGDALLAQKKYWEALELAKSTQGSTPLAQLQADLLGLRAQAALPDRDDRRIVRAVAEFARRRESAGADASGGTELERIDAVLAAWRQAEPLARGGLEHYECARSPSAPAPASAADSVDVRKPARVLRVGPGGSYATIAAAAREARDGDLVEIAAGDYSGDVAAWEQNDLVLRGVGGRPHLRAAERNSQGKGIWVISGDNATVENIEFSGASVPDGNGAGIRFEGRRLTVRNSYFHDNENGILTSNRDDAEVVIEFCEFARNGVGDGYTHNIYIGHSASFVLRGSYSHEARVGHLVKSRAQVNQILYNRLTDETDGTSSYNVDLPDGGRALLLGNLLQQGSRTENPAIVSFAAEKAAGPGDELYVASNTFYNMWLDGIFVDNKSASPARVVNNVFSGAPAQTVRGAAELVGNVIGPRAALADPRVGDFHLTADSIAIDAAQDPSSAGAWLLVPSLEYVHPASVRARPVIYLRDAGALEFCGW